MDLRTQVQLTGWATPTKRDHKDGASEGTAEINALLGRQVWLAGWYTPIKNDGLRGYGDGIVAPLVEEFIRCYIEERGITFTRFNVVESSE